MRALALALALGLLPVAVRAQNLVTIDLSLSPRAMTELAGQAEMVVVSAFYWGEPAPGATIEPDDMGQIFLGSEEHVIWPVPQTVRLGANIASMPLAQVATPMLNVNVFSARFASEDNLLECGLVDAPVADLMGTVQAVACKLIGE
ncbi:MAG: hypothetical protein ACK414_11190 [Gemmobacter sp.]